MTHFKIVFLTLTALLWLCLAPSGVEAQTTIFLDQTLGDDANDGLDWATAYRSFAAVKERLATDVEVTGVNIAHGWYRGSVILDRPVNFVGGFSPGGGELNLWRWRAMIIGDGQGPVFRYLPGSGGALLGLVVRGGRATDEAIAGGITAIGAPISIAWCVIEDNVGCRGGGLHLDTRGMPSGPRLTSVVVRNNVATCDAGTGLGGGAYVLVDEATPAAPPVIVDCRFEANAADSDPSGGIIAGGAHVEGNVSVEGTTFVANDGTGLVLSSGINPLFEPSAAVKSCVFADNTAYGAAITCPGTYPLSYSTFQGNASGAIGSYQYPAPDPTTLVDLNGSILWQQPGEVLNDTCDAAEFAVTDSLVEGGYPAGSGIVDFDPLFIAGPRGRFYLPQTMAGDSVDSPAVDAGPVNAVDVGMQLRTTRVDSAGDIDVVDLGAHYFSSDFVEGPMIAIDRYEDLSAPVLLISTPRFPFLDEPGLLSDGTRPLLYYRVSHLKLPLIVSKDRATDSILLSY